MGNLQLVFYTRLSSAARKVKPFGAETATPLDPGRWLGHIACMLIYKIFRASEWEAFRAAGQTDGAPVDLADGFIHFSTAAQAAETAAKHFADETGLVLLALDSEALGPELTWEPSRGGALFPHLYRTLSRADVLWDRPLPLGATGHVFPEEMK